MVFSEHLQPVMARNTGPPRFTIRIGAALVRIVVGGCLRGTIRITPLTTPLSEYEYGFTGLESTCPTKTLARLVWLLRARHDLHFPPLSFGG